MITGTILVYSQTTFVLSDPRSTYSYVFAKFGLGLDLICDVLDTSIFVSTPVGDSAVVTPVYHSYSVMFVDF